MRPKQTRTKRRKKQREGTEAKKDKIKKQKKGDYNATLQPWREQTATVKVSFGPDYLFAHMSKRRNQPFMHMPTRSCRHVLCVLPICPHIDFPALAWNAIFAHLDMACSCCRSNPVSDPICLQREPEASRLIIDCWDEFDVSIPGQ